jgi:iron-sulfur cluster assembly accessory protein
MDQTTVTDTVTLNPLAAQKVADFLEAAGDVDEGTCLRLGVRGGGCSGYQYQLALDVCSPDDHLFESEGQRIIVSSEALPLVKGACIVWKETLMNSGFDVENPNAVAACGCGSSFRVDPDAKGCSEPEGPESASSEEVYL